MAVKLIIFKKKIRKYKRSPIWRKRYLSYVRYTQKKRWDLMEKFEMSFRHQVDEFNYEV